MSAHVNPIPQPDPQLPVSGIKDRALFAGGMAVAFAAALGLGAIAAYENCPSELESMQQTALAVEDTDAAARQVEADHLFNRRVQLTGDTICIRTAGPSYRATWSGADETMHCVPKDQAQPKKHRLVLVAGGGSMTELSYVNVYGIPVNVEAGLSAKPAKKPANSSSGLTEFFKGYRVIGHPPGALEEARAEHQSRQAKKAKPEEFDEEAWLRTARKKPVRSQPYALVDAADTCVQLALKAGWLAVERVAIERRKV